MDTTREGDESLNRTVPYFTLASTTRVAISHSSTVKILKRSQPLMQIPTSILFTKSTSSNQKILPTKREIGKQWMEVESLPSSPLALTSSYSKTILINFISWKRLHLYSQMHRQPSACSDLKEALHLGGGWKNLLR